MSELRYNDLNKTVKQHIIDMCETKYSTGNKTLVDIRDHITALRTMAEKFGYPQNASALHRLGQELDTIMRRHNKGGI